MADLTIAAHVTRPEVGGGNLAIENPGVYRLVPGTGRGGLTWDRTEVVSSYVHGSTLVRARKELVIAPLKIRVYGTSGTELDSRIAALCRAFEQTAYRVVMTINGNTSEWKCRMADYDTVDGEWDKFSLMAFQQVYAFQVPRDPTPVQGAH